MDEWDSYETIQTGLPKGRWATLVYINARGGDITVETPTHTVLCMQGLLSLGVTSGAWQHTSTCNNNHNNVGSEIIRKI